MKILRICPAPPHNVEFRKSHHLKNKSFKEQIHLLRSENLLLPGGWAAAMEAEGFEVFETLYNDPVLQARWAVENEKDNLIRESNYLFKIISEQVKSFQPDIIFLYGGAFFWATRQFRAQLQALCKKRIILSGFWGDELPHGWDYGEEFGDLDLVFCSSSVYQKKLEGAGINAISVGNCFDDTISYIKPTTKREDFIFCGTTGFAYPDHVGRYEKIVEITSKSRLRILANEPRITNRSMQEICLNFLASLPTPVIRILSAISPGGGRLARGLNLALILGETGLNAGSMYRQKSGHRFATYFDNKKSLKQLFPSRVSSLLPNCSDYYSLIAGTKLVLNLHRDEDADIGNIRCFEVTGLGSCLVTDRGKELAEFFDIENDIVTFETVDECLEKVRFLLNHPEEIERISKNGQRTTLSLHTVKQRCHQISEKLKEHFGGASNSIIRKRKIVLATYDFEKHPVSYDIAFFLQAAEIYRKSSQADGLVINIVQPADMKNMPGVSQAADSIVNSDARDFRVFHICTQIAQLMKTKGVFSIKDRFIQNILTKDPEIDMIQYPGKSLDHHSMYYRLVNEHPNLVTGFSASSEARRYVKLWLDPIATGRKVLCITLRQYQFDPQRNSDINAWRHFLDRIDSSEFAVIIIPDTDHIAEFKTSVLGHYPCFEPACFDVDLRFALYEKSYLNMFVNNGPGAAATLDKKVRYLMFKILVPSVPHCTEEFLKWNGFEIGTTPKYATQFQKWVWEDDTTDVLWREFRAMTDRIRSESPEVLGDAARIEMRMP